MGFLNDVFDGRKGFLGKLGETLQDIGWTIGAPASTAVDLARVGYDKLAGIQGGPTVGSALSEGINRGTQILLGDNAGTPDNKADDTPNLISPGVGKAMDGLEWVYQNAIAQPINTANITEQRVLAGLTGTEDNAHPWDIGSAWNRADAKTGGYAGKGTSLGRESAYTWDALIGLATGFRGSLTDEGQKVLDEQSKLFDVQSGIGDAASRIFLDPTIVLGKAAKALKFSAFIRGVKDTSALQKALAENKAWGGLFDSFGTRLEKANDFNMGLDIGRPRSALEIYAANPGMQATGGDGWSTAQVIESASKSLWAAKAAPDEIRAQGKLIALASTGDGNAALEMSDKVAAARDALASFKSDRNDLLTARDWNLRQVDPFLVREAATKVASKYKFVDDVASMGEDYFQSDEFMNLTAERLKAIKPQFTAAKKEIARTEKLAQQFTGDDSLMGSLKDYPLLSGAVGGTKAMAKRADKEMGVSPARLDFVFQSSAWNKAVKLKVPQLLVPHLYYGVKAHQAMGRIQAPRTIDFHDPNAPMAVNNFLKHSAVSAETREQLVGAMAGASGKEGAMRSVVEDAVMHAQKSMIDKYMRENPHFTEATAQTVINEQAKIIQQEADRLKLQTRKFTAHTSDETGQPGDAIFDEEGFVKYSPLLETQLENQMVLPDLRAFTKVLDRHSGWLSDMAEWAQGNRVPDPGRINELGTKLFDKAVSVRPGLDLRTARRADTAAEKLWRAGQYKDLALTGLTRAWKMAVLLRPAYPMRVLMDSDMRALAVLGPQAFTMHTAPRAFGFATMGGASRIKTAFAAHADDLRLTKMKSDLEEFEDRWKATNDGRIENITQFLDRQRGPEPGIRYQVVGDPEPKLLRIDRATKKRVESKLDYIYRVVSSDDYARMKANGYLDTRFDEHLEGAYHSDTEANQVGMFGQATVDKMLLATYGKAPGNVVMRIAVKPGDGWVRDTLDKDPEGWPLPILSTPKRLPFDRVTDVSPRFKGGGDHSILRGDPQVTDLDASDEYTALSKEASAIEKKLTQYRNGGRAGRRATYGRFGEVGQKDIQTVAGKIPGAFADDYGKQQRYIASSKSSAGIMGDSEKLAMQALMTENWVSLTPSDANHMESWLHAVNAQLKNSELGKKALEFQMKAGDDPERAVNALRGWMRNTPEGRAIKARMAWDTANGEAHAREIVGYVNHYLPTPELRNKALTDRINQRDIEAAFPEPGDRPPVHGPALARSVGRGSVSGKMINDWFSRTMRWLSDAPEDQLARHPMYAAVYEQEAKRQAEFLMANPAVEDVSMSDIQNMVQKRAHKKAQQSLKTYMFDVAAQSDLSHALRFTSPFIAAWEDTMKKWGKIASDDPSVLGKAYLAWNAPNDMGLVVDDKGHPVKQDDFNAGNYMLVQWPSWVPKVGGKGIDLLPGFNIAPENGFRIPKQSVNVILQGGLQPGFGPLVAIPVAKLQMANPELNDVAKFVNPYGPPQSVWDAVAPSTVKRIEELVNTQSRAHMYDTYTIFAAQQAEYRLDPEKFGNKPPTWQDAATKAKWVGVLKIINNSSSPFPAIFDSKYRLFQDSYRDLQNKQRTDNLPTGWADEQFIKAYGEAFFPLVQSMSKNNAGLGATAEGVNASKKYASQISQYAMESGQPNKNLARLIVGPEGEGAYNQSAHRWQETREMSPGSGVTFRDVSNSQQAAADADAALGWYKYRAFMNTMDAKANEQGLRSYAEDQTLVDTKKEFVKNLKDQIPAWGVDFDQMDPQKFTRDLTALSKVATDPQFGVERTDMAGTRQYLVLRQALQKQLADAGISEGSQDALPLKQAFTDEVMNMVGQNTSFAEWAFHPFLERDPLLANLVPATTFDPSGLDTATQWGFN